MLKFEAITPEILSEIKPHIENSNIRLCDYTIGCLFLWCNYFNMQYTFASNMLVCTSETKERGLYYTYPVGKGDFDAALDTIAEDARTRHIPLQFCCVPEDCIASLTHRLGEPLSIAFDRTWSDYLYPYDNFCGYRGKALHAQRNHVNRFLREYPHYSYTHLTEYNIERARAFMHQNYSEFAKDIDIAAEELLRLDDLFENYGRLHLSGGLLIVDGVIIGLTIGEAVGDTLHVHVEKALTAYHGSFQMLAMCFAEQMKNDSLLYINRQDDTGDAGLRKSKLSYKPCEMLNKYYVVFNHSI